MFDHAIALLEEALFATTMRGKEEGRAERMNDYAHAVAVLKAAGAVDKAKAATMMFLVGRTLDDEFEDCIIAGQIRRLIEALPEVKP